MKSLKSKRKYTYDLIFSIPFVLSGKGDLVGCDISLNLMHNGQVQGGQDTILKSSSDVKVCFSKYV